MSHRYDAIVIGSGICGTSLAFHLSRRGAERVLVLEQGALCSGTTSHAPGLAGQLRADLALMRILRESIGVYAESGGGGYQAVGSLRLASSPARLRELERQRIAADEAGLGNALLSTAEAQSRFPLLDPTGVEGALWIPSDGSADAVALTTSLRHHAESLDVEFCAGLRVTGLPPGVVEIGAERLEAPVIVLATGIWSGPLARLAGVHLPVVPMQHQVVWTEELDILDADNPLPNLRDPDHLVYFRQDGRRFVLGGYERSPRPLDPALIGAGPNPSVRSFDAAHFAPLLAGGQARVPLFREPAAPFSRTLNGLESFTPDGHFLLGRFPQRPDLWAACGFCAHGVSGSGGVGKYVADWITDGAPPFPADHMDVSRYQAQPLSFAEAAEAVCGIYSTYYDIDRSV
jgi:4-methylaminobutanoate oxidase (formaldehyde-forming)